MTVTRRNLLMHTLFGAGALGLRSLATGLPVSFFLNPRRAAAAGACADATKAQYFILSTSAAGDPINASSPGTYSDPKIIHSPDPAMAPTPIIMRGQTYQAAMPWSTLGTLPGAVLDRTTFWHLMTNTPIHPNEPKVLALMGASPKNEMLPSLLAKTLAPCLKTVQAQPLAIGSSGPAEALAYDTAPLPIIPPVALKDTLANPAGPLTQLQSIRDQTMSQVYALYKNGATPTEQAYIDSMVNTQQQVRSLNLTLLNSLSQIKDNSVASQIVAAITVIQMNISPVISIHIPFGGDNHSDTGLATETAQTLSGVASIVSLLQQLQAAGLQDKVTFMTLNVFGRGLLMNGNNPATDGRPHNGNHQVSITIGKPFKGGVIGGVAPVGVDYGATGIDSASGLSTSGGDILPAETLGSFAQTMLAAVGGDPTTVSKGKVITAALA